MMTCCPTWRTERNENLERCKNIGHVRLRMAGSLRSLLWSNHCTQGGIFMKKMDEATGLTIEVPQGNARGKFPYSGFWSNYATKIADEISKSGDVRASRGDISEAMNQLVGLINGDYRILLADKVWAIGETLDLNPQISATGNHGGSIRRVPESADGGRLAFAAHTFAKPVKIIIETAKQRSNTGTALNNLDSIARNASSDVQRLNLELIALENKRPSKNQFMQFDSNIQGLQIQVHQTMMECEAAETSYYNLKNSMDEYNKLKNEMHTLSQEKQTIGIEMQNKLRQIQNIEKTLPAGAITAQAESLMSLRSQTQVLANRNMQIHQRINNLGLHLERMNAEGDQKQLLRTLNSTMKMCKNKYNKLVEQLRILENEKALLLEEDAMIQQAIDDASSMVRSRSLEAEKAVRMLENARNVASNTMTFDADAVVRVFAAHLSSVQMDVERYLFENLREAQRAISNRPTSRMAEYVVSPEVVRDYEAFLGALDMISDAIDDDEYDLLQKIGKLGASQSYVPGSARVMALLEMNRGNRMTAYRNMIEEILASGITASKRPSTGAGLIANFSAGNFNLKFDFSAPLTELEELVNHLANSGLEFEYQGGM